MSFLFESEKNKQFMNLALEQAQEAFINDEVPIGAVVVDAQGTLLAQAYNQVELQKTQTAHAEIIVLQKAAKQIEDWRLEGCWLYVTLEPCSMCMGLIRLSRLAGVVFAASSPLFGYRLDNRSQSQLYKNDSLTVLSGVCEKEAIQLLKHFFKEKR